MLCGSLGRCVHVRETRYLMDSSHHMPHVPLELRSVPRAANGTSPSPFQVAVIFLFLLRFIIDKLKAQLHASMADSKAISDLLAPGTAIPE